jgi:hypothetical protein
MNNKLKEFEEFCWTMHYSKFKIKPWEIETLSGRNGGKLFNSSWRSKIEKVWN